MRSLRSVMIVSGLSWLWAATWGTPRERRFQVNSVGLRQVPTGRRNRGLLKGCASGVTRQASDPLLGLWPAESEEKRTPGDRAPERRRDPKRQARLDRAFGVVDEGLSGLLVALELRKGDARLAEDRAIPLHHQHDRQPRAGRTGSLSRHACAELALKVDERVRWRGIVSERQVFGEHSGGASERRGQCDHRPGVPH